jgi:pilus assembly protein CpaB
MDRRRLLLFLAVIVAVLGTALVFFYVRGADNRAQAKLDNVDVLKATQNIASGESYDTALSSGKISMQPVPKNQLNTGYVTSTTELKGMTASAPIYAGQQIIKPQFSKNSVNTVEAQSPLPIPKGDIAIAVNLEDPDRVAGNILDGSRVAIFVTDTSNGETKLLLPDVTVLNVGSPVPTTSTTTDQSGTATTETLPRTLLTVAVSQSEAQKVVLGSKTEVLTFGLRTPVSKLSQHAPGTHTQQLFK